MSMSRCSSTHHVRRRWSLALVVAGLALALAVPVSAHHDNAESEPVAVSDLEDSREVTARLGTNLHAATGSDPTAEAESERVTPPQTAGPPSVAPVPQGPDNEQGYACTGPPPFAGTPPQSEEARAAEAEAFSAWREGNCPDDDADDSPERAGPPSVAPVPQGPDNEQGFACTGPPPFAGTPPQSEEARAAEAEAFSAWRDRNCPDDDADV